MIGSAKNIANWIRQNDDIAVCVHFRPDGDAYGTALALCAAIRALGKRAFPACDDPVEAKYLFLPGSEAFSNAERMPFVPKAVLGADVSEASRMGEFEKVFFSCDARAVLDHHATNAGFGNVNYIDEHSASAGEMALNVIDELGVEITKDMALALFTAISTDCGNFSFQNTTADTYRSAARCVEAGVDVESATRILYRTRSVAKTRLLGRALDHIEMFEGGRVAAIRLTKQMYTDTGAVSADAHSIVNYLNEIEDVRVGVLAEETGDGVKFSFRSAGNVNVAKLAQEFGGGGHMAAAGANVSNVKIDDIFPRAIEAAARYAREFA